MKKIRLSFLCMCLCVGTLALSSCGNDDEDDNKSFTVTFDTDGGSEVESQTIEKGNSATKPEDPTKNDYYFDGWYNNGKLYNFKTPVTSNLTLVAKWEEYEYVDLGLPSGTLWATCNVGARHPWDRGDYFAWGETKPKDAYSWSTYKYSNDGVSDYRLTKYCDQPKYGDNGFTDDIMQLQPMDDAATVNWGSSWRMPTQAEFQELCDNCRWVKRVNNYVSGYIIYTKDENIHIFLPITGYRDGLDHYLADGVGSYWSSSLATNRPINGLSLQIASYEELPDHKDFRSIGMPVRPVKCK